MGILSIQSHVATGRVGNAIVAFALQRLGHEVWPVHTVMFSNHPGRGGYRGKVRAAEDLTEIVTGLDEQGVFARCDAVLGGYLGDAKNGAVLLAAVDTVRSRKPSTLFFLDPVMGDAGKGIYVSPDVVAFYRNAIGDADVLAPNAFELGVLTDRAIAGPDDAIAAARSLLGPRLRTVFVTSVDMPSASELVTLAVDAERAIGVATPRLEIDPKGAGDLFMALAAAELLDGGSLETVLKRSVSVVWGLADAARKAPEPGDLPVIEHQDILVSPERTFCAERL